MLSSEDDFCMYLKNLRNSQLLIKRCRYCLAIVFVLLIFNSNARVYYISSSGNDSNPGTSENLAWRSLAKVNIFTPSPGDQILFKRGDAWSGTITVNASGTSGSPIVYGAYGSGEKPKIYGSEEVTGWTKHSGNIYKASFNSEIEQLFIDAKRMMLARTPNTGYHNTTSTSSSTTFTSTDLDGSINYSGASWVGRTSAFTMFSKTVTSSSSQTIVLNSAPDLGLGVGEGFFVCNKLELLDSAGEWYYDNATNTVYFWTPNSNSPSNYMVRGSIFDYGVNMSGNNYIEVNNFEIQHSSKNGIFINNSDYVTVDNNHIISPDLFGINIPSTGSNNTKITNNYIYQANTMAINCKSASSIITDNIIEDTGLLENINKEIVPNDYNFGTGIFSRGDNPIIKYNRVINSGYIGINWKGQNGNISYNYVNGACLVLDDGGGIYTYNGYEYSNPASASA